MIEEKNTFICPHCRIRYEIKPVLEGDALIFDEVEIERFKNITTYIKNLAKAFKKRSLREKAAALEKFGTAVKTGEINFCEDIEVVFEKLTGLGFSMEFARLWQFYSQTGRLKPQYYKITDILKKAD